MTHTILSSPLQGITDFRFRNAFQKYFGGVDLFYAPYFRMHSKAEIKASDKRDLFPQNNIGITLIPQIMTSDTEEFLFVANYVKQLGYDELNWNMGCPFPMVTKRGLGSGLLAFPEKIDGILKKVFAESNITISVKMRLGNENSDEIFKVLPILDSYPIKDITIHPRIGKQMYKGDVDLDAFQRCLENTKHKICYNGDITTVEKFNEMAARFPSVDRWMIGRGMIADPFLPAMIKANTCEYPENKPETFKKFHDTLFHDYEQALSGSSHLIMKMWSFWEYFALSFQNPHKGMKKIKKAKTIVAYLDGVREILNAEKV